MILRIVAPIVLSHWDDMLPVGTYFLAVNITSIISVAFLSQTISPLPPSLSESLLAKDIYCIFRGEVEGGRGFCLISPKLANVIPKTSVWNSR